jgi:IS1 family transposase
MNNLSIEKKEQILTMLIEGCSIRSAERMTNVHRDTIMRLLVRTGNECKTALDKYLTGFHCSKVQVDEIWTFCKKKEKQLIGLEKFNPNLGDQYVFVAIDADTKLIPAFVVGKRDITTALKLMTELKNKLNGNGRIQLTTDGLRAYIDTVEQVFGSDVDYAQLIKVYGIDQRDETSYSPPKVKEVLSKVINGNPDPNFVSTSYVERQNLTMRMAMRRFTRLTNAFSKKIENLKATLALHFAHYNFMRVHRTLKVTPAMEAGITNHIWGWKDLLPIELN